MNTNNQTTNTDMNQTQSSGINSTQIGDAEILNHIYQNAKMGTDSLSALIPKVTNPALKKDLTTQLLGYQNFANTSAQKLQAMNMTATDIDLLGKLPAYFGIKLNTMMDSSTSHIAEMLIKGSNMGVIELTKKMNEHKQVAPDITQLSTEVFNFEQGNINKYMTYL
ncbi:MAG: hypothetical protein AB9835_04180 [Eubacteriales bacterium]